MGIQTEKGFTLIEVMIVVAIIGILASIALPTYQTFIARSQVAESIVLLDAAKVNSDDSIIVYGDFPVDKIALIALNTKVLGTYGNITGVNNPVDDAGTIVYQLNNTVNKNIRDTSVWYTRVGGAGNWSCATNLSQKFAPKGCVTINPAPVGS